MRKVLIASFALVHAMCAPAQVEIGVKAGVNYNVWSTIEFNWYQIGTYPPVRYSGVGFHVGGLLRAPISGTLAFRCELLYSARNVSHEMDATITYFDGFVGHTQRVHGTDEFRLGYLEMPLLVSKRLGRHLDLQLGPVIGIGLRFQRESVFTLEESFSGSTDFKTFDTESTGQVIDKSVDPGIVASAGYEWDGGFELGLRYTRGFTSTGVSGNAVYWSGTGDGIHQNVFQFSLGFWFNKR